MASPLLAGLSPQLAQHFDAGRCAGVSVENGIPRFTPSASYSRGNFALLRERHASLQLDSRNGTTDRLETLLDRTAWPGEFFRGRSVLECGCGAGPDTEILLSLGARVVAVDLAGLDVAQANVGRRPDVQFVQASICDLPLRPHSFDIVFCHRVLQHTPDPASALRHILGFVRPGGAAFVHSYARTRRQLLHWKYALRPFARRLDPEVLYRIIARAALPLFHLTNRLQRAGGFACAWSRACIPFCNYRHKPKFRAQPDAFLIEFGIHDTFDALSPPYDRPLAASAMRRIAAERLTAPFEVVEGPTTTLLRTLPGAARP